MVQSLYLWQDDRTGLLLSGPQKTPTSDLYIQLLNILFPATYLMKAQKLLDVIPWIQLRTTVHSISPSPEKT
jgi:hypothetical protein